MGWGGWFEKKDADVGFLLVEQAQGVPRSEDSQCDDGPNGHLRTVPKLAM